MFFWQILLNSLVLGTQVLLLTFSLYLIYSVSRVYHLALGATGICVSYAIYSVLTNSGNFLFAILFGLVMAICLGLVSYFALQSTIEKRDTMSGMLISLSIGIILESLISIIFGTDAKYLVQSVLPTVSFFNLHITTPGLITIIIGIIFALIFLLVKNKTPWGRKLNSVAENDSLVSSLGIKASAVRISVFVLASVLAGIVGTMTTLNTALTPTSGFSLIILSFIVLLVGGLKSVKGIIISSYLLVIIPEFIISFSGNGWYLSSSWKMLLIFVLAALVLTFRPSGLFTDKLRAD